MKKMERISKLMMTAILSAALVLSMMPLWSDSVYAAGRTPQQTYELVMNSAAPDSFMDEKYEPFGHGDIPFSMNTESELLFYMTNKNSSGDITTFYDKLKAGNTGDILTGNTASTALKAPPVGLKKASFVQAVAFDPRGCGRDDHIAFIGVNSTKYAYVWVYDTRNKRWSTDNNGISLVACRWMKNITDFEAANFLSITAGDYNGDGRESLVAYACGDGSNHKAFEITADTPDVGASGNISLTKTDIGTGFLREFYNKWDDTDESIYQIGCDLASGDINGDRIDDLAAVTYFQDINSKNQKARAYRPELKVMYGKEGGPFPLNFGDTRISTIDLWPTQNNADDDIRNKNWDSVVSPGVAVGDIDGDKVDEIIAAGIKNTIHANGDANAGTPRDIDIDKTEVFIVNDGKMVQKEVSTNSWSASGFYPNDDVWCKTEVECVAVDGPMKPEKVFISGTLYNINGDSVNAVHTPAYFNSSSDGLSKSSTNMYVQSAAAGNFDGNGHGREQIVFTCSCKTSGANNYDYLMGVIGGKDFDKNTGVSTGYYSTSERSMDDGFYDTGGEEDDGNNSYPGRVEGGSNESTNIENDKGLNCIAVAVDNDTDGILVKYAGKQLVLADPDILCVLQAAPYFKEIADYSGGPGSTTYRITHSYSFEKTEGRSSSYSVAVGAKVGTPAVEVEVQAGTSSSWTEEFTEAFENQEEYHWTATNTDTVVVSRAPVICYTYQVQNASGGWGDPDRDLVISVPENPSYSKLSVEEYNQFAEYYNSQVPADARKLQQLDNTWLGLEGQPDQYISTTNKLFNTANNGYELMQKSFQTLGHTGGSSGWSLDKGTSSSVAKGLEHGLSFDASVALGADLGPVQLQATASTSLENMSSSSTTETKATSTGVEGEVEDINDSEIPDDLNPHLFSFSYRMATWPSGLKRFVKGKADEDIPVFGYALSAVYNPVTQGALSPAAAEAFVVNGLLDSFGNATNLTLDNEDDVNYIREEYENLSEEAKGCVDESRIDKAEAKIQALKDYETDASMDITNWDIELSGTTFSFKNKVQKPVIKSIWGFPLVEGQDYEVTWSNPSSKNAGTYKLTITGIGRFTGSTSAAYKIKKVANQLSVKGRTAIVRYKKLKKRSQTLKVSQVIRTLKKGNGKVTYSRVSGNRKIKIAKSGKVTVKKGLKKKTYKVIVRVKAAGNVNYNAKTQKVTFKIRVK